MGSPIARLPLQISLGGPGLETRETARFLDSQETPHYLPVAFPRLRAAGVAQLVEHLICNEVVGGSSPFASSFVRRSRPASRPERPGRSSDSPAGRHPHRGCWRCGGMPERPKGADCKSAGLCLRRFESFSLHHFNRPVRRAGIAQRLEHRPSKPRVAGSNPVSRSIFPLPGESPGRVPSVGEPGRAPRLSRERPGPDGRKTKLCRVSTSRIRPLPGAAEPSMASEQNRATHSIFGILR